jgi:hypothetical protein
MFGPHTYSSLKELGHALMGERYNVDDAQMLAETLQYCGILYKVKEGYSVAHLYRPALKSRNPEKAG